MNYNIIFDYPFWLVLLCIACGLTFSGLLYYRNKKDDLNKTLTVVLAVVRFIAVSLIALLLLAPLIQKMIQEVEEPLLVFLQDNSQSIVLAGDSTYYQDNYIPEMEAFLETMSDDFDTRLYAFGEYVRDDEISFSDRMTNISDVFREIDARYSNRNIGAVVLAGDGIYNRGANPLYASAAANYPVYTMALGDTVPRRDLIMKRVNHNRITYLGNRFPVEVIVEAFESRGMSSRLTISRDGEEVFGEDISFTSNHQVQTVALQLEADEPGMQQYSVALSPLQGEVNLQNNTGDFFIDVIDGRQQILILANGPHPDVGAIRQSLEENDHYEIESAMFKDFDGSLEAYDLVIMHQLPSNDHPSGRLFDEAGELGSSILYVVGSQTNISAFNAMQQALEIQPRSDDFVETLAHFNRSFVLFTLPESAIGLLDVLPPLFSPFANYRGAADANVLLYQKIGQVITEQPLVLFAESGQSRTGIITGEGLWRWRLNAFMRQGNHHAFDEMLSRIVQFLALQEDRSLFRVSAENLVFENDAVVFDAELYNRNYELINEPEVQLFLTNEEGVEFSYIMGRTANAYRLDAGTQAPGQYLWEARVTVGNEVYTDEGLFNVRSLDLESLQTIADHNLLFQLANNTGGQLFYPGEWDDMRMHINNREDIHDRLYSHKEFVEVINMKALFFIILLLLAAEWFVRKRSGGY